MSNDHYILAKDGRTAVLASSGAWAAWFETAGEERVVAVTKVGEETRVSTVFLGLDHRFGEGPPHIFETLVFGGPLDGQMERYSTWDEAERGHAAMVFSAEAALAATFPISVPAEPDSK